MDRRQKNGIVWGSTGGYNGIDDLAVHWPYHFEVWGHGDVHTCRSTLGIWRWDAKDVWVLPTLAFRSTTKACSSDTLIQLDEYVAGLPPVPEAKASTAVSKQQGVSARSVLIAQHAIFG